MQIPISVNRSKAAGPAACSRAAGLAASVWRGARRGRAAGKPAGAGSGQRCKVQPGEPPQGSGEGSAWDLAVLLCPLGQAPSSAPAVPAAPPGRSCCWDARWSPAPGSQLPAAAQPRGLGCSHLAPGSLQSSPLMYQPSLEEGSVP